MLPFRLTADAQQDLIKIRQYTVSTWGAKQSVSYLTTLKSTIERLCEFPTLGKRQEEVGGNVRSFSIKHHVVYYLVQEQELIVFAILHSRMVPMAHLQNRQV